jgi:hypothetical protein
VKKEELAAPWSDAAPAALRWPLQATLPPRARMERERRRRRRQRRPLLPSAAAARAAAAGWRPRRRVWTLTS